MTVFVWDRLLDRLWLVAGNNLINRSQPSGPLYYKRCSSFVMCTAVHVLKRKANGVAVGGVYLVYRKWGFLVSYSVCFCLCNDDDDDRGFRLIRFLLLEP